MKRILVFAAALLLAASTAFAQLGTTTVTNNLQVTPVAEAALTIGATATTLTSPGTNFSNYTGTTNFTYFIRTSQTGGTGSIVLQVTSDFAPAGGPSVASPATGDALTYTCTVSSPGTACTGSLTASTSGTTSVATFSAAAHSAKSGNSASVTWTLPNDPQYQTGNTYTATVTYTISAS
jgi:hypothetical protein